MSCEQSKIQFFVNVERKDCLSALFLVWMLQNQIMCFKGIYSYISIGHFRYIKIQHMARRLRGHIQRKLNDHVCSFLLFVSSRPHYFNISIVAYWYPVSTLHHQVLIKCWPSINRDVDRVLIRSFDPQLTENVLSTHDSQHLRSVCQNAHQPHIVLNFLQAIFLSNSNDIIISQVCRHCNLYSMCKLQTSRSNFGQRLHAISSLVL